MLYLLIATEKHATGHMLLSMLLSGGYRMQLPFLRGGDATVRACVRACVRAPYVIKRVVRGVVSGVDIRYSF